MAGLSTKMKIHPSFAKSRFWRGMSGLSLYIERKSKKWFACNK